MSVKLHVYRPVVRWTGNRGAGTSGYAAYDRAFACYATGKPELLGSSDPAFRGDPSRWNPEEMLVASLSACHQLWYLHLCAEAGIVVVNYEDRPVGTMEEDADGAGQFTSILLRPFAVITPGSDAARAAALHAAASRMCFIERTLRCKVEHQATTHVAHGWPDAAGAPEAPPADRDAQEKP